jgi:hypothetical protein
VPINDSDYTQSVQLGEKICLAAMKCFIVSLDLTIAILVLI